MAAPVTMFSIKSPNLNRGAWLTSAPGLATAERAVRTAREAERTKLAAVTDGRGCAQAVGHARQHIGVAPETHISRICRDWPTSAPGPRTAGSLVRK